MHISPYKPEIRFSDIDALGHVNNAVYLSYFEQSRMHFFAQLIGKKWDWNQFGLLVAKNEITYKIPILLNDNVEIHVGCKHVGSKSFIIDYRIEINREGKAAVAAFGESVLVSFNHSLGQTSEIPEVWKNFFLQLKPATDKLG